MVEDKEGFTSKCRQVGMELCKVPVNRNSTITTHVLEDKILKFSWNIQNGMPILVEHTDVLRFFIRYT